MATKSLRDNKVKKRIPTFQEFPQHFISTDAKMAKMFKYYVISILLSGPKLLQSLII